MQKISSDTERQKYLIGIVTWIMTLFTILTTKMHAAMSLKQTLTFMIRFWSEYCTVVSQQLVTEFVATP
jgi:hypothetical protein